MKKRVVTLLFTLIMTLIISLGLFSITSNAAETTASGTCGDNLTWTLDSEGTLTISGTGEMTSYSYTTAPWYVHRSSINKIVIGDSVTSIGMCAFYDCESITSVVISDGVISIGDYAFYDCDSLTSINIPDSVTSIGDYAFQYCKLLTSVVIGDGVTSIGDSAFDYCGSLTSVVIGDGVTSIGDHAFKWCSSLTSVNIPDGVTSIGDYMFYDCSSLTSINIPAVVTSIGDWAFYNCGFTSIDIPDGVTTIGDSAFYRCSALTSINISDGVTSIGNSAFSSCDSLTSINIPDSVTSIGDYAFQYCKLLTSVVIGDGVTSIGDHAFKWCSSLTSIDIPDGVTTIGDSAFYRCSALTSINISDGVTSIGNSAFSSCDSLTSINIPDSVTSIGDYAFQYCKLLTSVVIGDGVTSIGDHAFDYCGSLTSVVIGDGVTSIGDHAFKWCSSLTSINIPDGVTSIGDWAFCNCGFTSIDIPDGVTTIGDSAFYRCSALTSINISDGVTSIGNSAFSSCDSLTNISVSENNPSYKDIDGNLYSKNETMLVQYAIGKTDTIFKIPDSVTCIGDGAFYGCRSLKYNEFDNALYLGNTNNPYLVLVKAKSKNIQSCTIHEQTRIILDHAFYWCDSLAFIGIPDSVTSIGEYAFYDCSSLTSINIPDGVTSIGDWTFYNCTFTSIDIPDGVTSIGEYAFYDCGSLISINIPGSVTSIGDSAFYDCNKLTIYGYYNTAIHSYASKNNIAFEALLCNPCSFDQETVSGQYFKAYENCSASYYKHCLCGKVSDTEVFYYGDYHNYVEKVSDNYLVSDATSDSPAVYYKSCEVCGLAGSDTFELSAPPELCVITYNFAGDITTEEIEVGATITIPSMTSTKYILEGWAIVEDGEIVYSVGDSAVFYDDITLYAIILKICSQCGGDGSKVITKRCECFCLACSGTGIRFSEYRVCDPHYINSFTGVCRRCNNVGMYLYTQNCYLCNGDGSTANGTCSSCNGSFFVSDTVDCDNCNADGSYKPIQISYDANGGDNAPSQVEVSGNAFVISSQIPTKEGYVFVGWNTLTDNNAVYNYGDTYNFIESITLYAMWQPICDDCDGNGHIKVIEECNACYGKGYKTEEKRKCNDCGSTYVVENVGNAEWGYGSYYQCMSCDSLDCSLLGTVKQDCNKCVDGSKTNVFTCETCNGAGAIRYEAPVIISYSDIKVVLVPKEGYEYSLDCVNWQSSNVFDGLQPRTTYTFYQRVTATDTVPFGCTSYGVEITTDKSDNTSIPPMCTVSSVTSNSITLNQIDGCEYSMDGVNWQSDLVFTNLDIATEYVIYARYIETNTHYAGEKSEGLVVKTDKGVPDKPFPPTLESKKYNKVVLIAEEGYEYSRDGINWQTSNVFLNLDSNTNYLFFRRSVETDFYYASESSDYLKVKTDKTPDITVEFAISFVVDDEIISSATYHFGDVIAVPSNPTKPVDGFYAYTFIGWDIDGDGKSDDLPTIADEDLTAVAIFTEECTHIAFTWSWSDQLGVEKCVCDNCQFVLESRSNHLYGAWVPLVDAGCITEGRLGYYQCDCGIYVDAEYHSLEDLVIDPLGHDMLPATCTESSKCKRKGCNHTEGSALGHSWLDATCTTAKTCSTCGATEGSALGHSWNNATCTTPKTCSVCNATEGSALGHSWENATCITPKICSVCNAIEGSALGHTWVNATCTTPKTCSVCNATEGSALGHTWVNATCTTPKTCSVCNATEGAALGHSWIDATCTTAKTCSTCGTTEGSSLGHTWINATCTTPKTCLVCNATEGSALGHSWIDATCTTAKTCSTCGATEGSALGHTWVNATCTTPKTCLVCNATEGSALRHSWIDATCTTAKTCSTCGTTEGSVLGHSWTNATCTTPKTCSVCRATEGSATGHSWNDGVVTKEPMVGESGVKAYTCIICGEQKVEILPALTGVVGDVDGNTEITSSDAVYLLMHTFFPEEYPVNQDSDFNGDGDVNSSDAVYLLMYTFFPEEYPLLNESPHAVLSFGKKEEQ